MVHFSNNHKINLVRRAASLIDRLVFLEANRSVKKLKPGTVVALVLI